MRKTVVLIGMMALILSACGKSEVPAAAPAASAPAQQPTETAQAAVAADDSIKVKLTQILKDYTDNEVNADNLYKGKRVQVSGRVAEIKKDLFDHPYIAIGTGAEFEIPQFQAGFDDNDAGKLTQLKKGLTVTVTCQVDGLMMNVQGINCALN
jgi:hypothetical protein